MSSNAFRHRTARTFAAFAVGTVLLSGMTMTGALADGLDDGAIVGIYNQVNSMDIETASVGQIRGHSADVRALAKMVANDHTGVRKAAHELAAKASIVPYLPAARADAAGDHYAVAVRLRGLSGADFDKAYLAHEIAFHEAAIKALREVLIPSATSKELKAHFEAVLPHFERHLSETIKTAQKLGYR